MVLPGHVMITPADLGPPVAYTASVTRPRRRANDPGPTAATSLDPGTGHYRPLSAAQREVNTAHARQRGPGERANAQLKSWKILRKIRSSPSRATTLVQAVQTLIITG